MANENMLSSLGLGDMLRDMIAAELRKAVAEALGSALVSAPVPLDPAAEKAAKKAAKAAKKAAFDAIAISLSDAEKAIVLAWRDTKSAPKGVNPWSVVKAAKSGKASPALYDAIKAAAAPAAKAKPKARIVKAAK